jgi:hypothetical protein
MQFCRKKLIIFILSWTENKMLEVLSNCEPEILQVGPEQCHGVDADYQTISILSDLYDRELVGIITWAKQIPGADQTFSPKYSFLIQIAGAFAKDATHPIYTSLDIHGDANY